MQVVFNRENSLQLVQNSGKFGYGWPMLDNIHIIRLPSILEKRENLKQENRWHIQRVRTKEDSLYIYVGFHRLNTTKHTWSKMMNHQKQTTANKKTSVRSSEQDYDVNKTRIIYDDNDGMDDKSEWSKKCMEAH